MALSAAERQALWRDRLTLRNDLLSASDEARRRKLRGPLSRIETPEAKHVKEFFANYPRCFTLPDLVDFENAVDGKGNPSGGWQIMMVYGVATPWECAAAQVALGEITSLPIEVIALKDDGYGYTHDAWHVAKVKEEVAEMRRLNIWGA